MKIVNVRGNVKKGCDVQLGAKTLIVGPNGSGKSSIVNTVELALTGRASDIAGRVDVAREVDVMSLAAGGSSDLEALAKFDDDVVAAYRTSGSTAKAKKATGDKPSDRCHDDVLPIRTLREAVLGSAVTARKYLLTKMTGEVSVEEIRQTVPDNLLPVFDSLFRDKGSKPADVLLAALEKAGGNARDAASMAKSAKQAASFVTQGAAIPPSKQEIAEIKKKAAGVQAQYIEATRRQGSAVLLPGLRAKHATLLEDAQRFAESLQLAEAELAALKETTPETPNEHVGVVLAVADLSIEAGGCMVCGGSVEGLAEVVGAVRDSVDSYLKHEKQKGWLNSSIDLAKRNLQQRVESIEALEAEIAMFESTEAPQEGPAPHDLQLEYEKLNERANDLTIKLNAWDSARKAQAQAEEAEENAAAWKEIKEHLESVIGALLENARAAFIAKVQQFLPGTDTFDLRLRDGDREVVQFGLVRDGHLHTALSGAEWARVLAALASACVPEGKYACLIPEERAFDAVTLGKVMRALGETPHQVILTSPVAPKYPPKDWVIIKRGDEE